MGNFFVSCDVVTIIIILWCRDASIMAPCACLYQHKSIFIIVVSTKDMSFYRDVLISNKTMSWPDLTELFFYYYSCCYYYQSFDGSINALIFSLSYTCIQVRLIIVYLLTNYYRILLVLVYNMYGVMHNVYYICLQYSVLIS